MDFYERKNSSNNININNNCTNSNRRKRSYPLNVDLNVNATKRSKISNSSPLDVSSSSQFNNQTNTNDNNKSVPEITRSPTTVTTLCINVSCQKSDETLLSVIHETVKEPASTSSCSSYHTIDEPSTSKNFFPNCNSNNNTIAKRKRLLSTCTNNSDPGFDLEPSAKRVPLDSPLSPSLQYEKNSTSSVVISPLPSDPPYYNSQHASDEEVDEEGEEYGIPSTLLPLSTSRLLSQNDVTGGYVIANCKENIDDDDDGSDCITDDDDDDCDIASEWSSYSSLSNTNSAKSLKSVAEDYVNDNNDVASVPIHEGERTPGQPVLSCHDVIKENNIVEESKISPSDSILCHRCSAPFNDNDQIRQCPLPALAWANASDVWQLMCHKDQLATTLRDPNMMDHHPSLQTRMRAILLDWLIEVCEVYKLHRETFYLAVDYLDRYLSIQKNVQKTHLQLIGITCLFIAAKVEEIYPPKIGEFAYVTDGACCEDDILKYEILLLKALQWNINPITPIGWLGVYMQLKVTNLNPASFKNTNTSSNSNNNITNNQQNISTSSYRHKKFEKVSKSPIKDDGIMPNISENVDKAFIYPQFSSLEFVQTAQLLDLCMLDIGINRFSSSVLAAAAMSLTFTKETATYCSGLDWQLIKPCTEWMQPFFQVVSEQSHTLFLLEQNENTATTYGLGHICPNIITDDSHTTQTHTISMAMFDRACLLQEQILVAKIKQENSPANGLLCPRGLLTPPTSDRKLLGDDKSEGNEIKVVVVKVEEQRHA